MHIITISLMLIWTHLISSYIEPIIIIIIKIFNRLYHRFLFPTIQIQYNTIPYHTVSSNFFLFVHIVSFIHLYQFVWSCVNIYLILYNFLHLYDDTILFIDSSSYRSHSMINVSKYIYIYTSMSIHVYPHPSPSPSTYTSISISISISTSISLTYICIYH